MSPKAALILGSKSDLPLFNDALALWKALGIEVEVEVSSAHRSPRKTRNLAEGAEARGVEVIIAGAGGAAHLAGVIAAHTTLPVIGVPVDIAPLQGWDALVSMVQMPKGVPVATVAVGKAGATNAAILSAQILGLKYPAVKEKLLRLKKKMAQDVAFKLDNILAELTPDAG
jgi:phosphoribosylaminoimidazole carboxylase PurE protein